MIQGALFDGPQNQASPARIASVAVELPVEGSYDYRIPAKLADKIQPGVRVWISFKGRRVAGVCLMVKDHSEFQDPLYVLGVLDDQPLVSKELLQLILWISRRYFCPVGEVFSAALPKGVRKGAGGRKIQTAALRMGVEEAYQLAEENLSKKPKQARILRILADSDGVLSIAELCSRANVSRSPVQTLEKGGLIKTFQMEVKTPCFDQQAPTFPKPQKLSEEQSIALSAIQEAIRQEEPTNFLIYGVTGSGKTEIYLRAIEDIIARGQKAIVLVPEISLTPQTVSRFKGRFDRVAVLHSRLTERERYNQWKTIQKGEADVVVGARSAIFAPIPNLGLIVVDEEHETSFKQQNAPHYHARTLALKRGEIEKASVLLGSATPSLESYYLACAKRLKPLTLKNRVGGGAFPEIRIVNMAQEKNPAGSFLSMPLKTGIEKTLRDKKQAIIFLNRRGFFTVLLCPACKETLKCPQCDISLTLHRKANRLICHYCGHEDLPPDHCPQCQWAPLKYVGAGTERVEHEIQNLFPRARILRMDSDTMLGRSAHETALTKFKAKEADILIGTQMIAKGLDFPSVTLVGVVSADMPLYQPDFRSSERAFQLLSQVSGRAGRGRAAGSVVVQTFDPDHPCIRHAINNDYLTFARNELISRKEAGYPPYRLLMRVVFSGEDPAEVESLALAGDRALSRLSLHEETALLGPARTPITMINGRSRWHLLIKASKREEIEKAAHCLKAFFVKTKRSYSRSIRMTLDMDPLSML